MKPFDFSSLIDLFKFLKCHFCRWRTSKTERINPSVYSTDDILCFTFFLLFFAESVLEPFVLIHKSFSLFLLLTKQTKRFYLIFFDELLLWIYADRQKNCSFVIVIEYSTKLSFDRTTRQEFHQLLNHYKRVQKALWKMNYEKIKILSH